MAQMYKSGISFTFIVAMETKMTAKMSENRILTEFETFDRAIYIEQKQIPKIYFNR